MRSISIKGFAVAALVALGACASLPPAGTAIETFRPTTMETVDRPFAVALADFSSGARNCLKVDGGLFSADVPLTWQVPTGSAKEVYHALGSRGMVAMLFKFEPIDAGQRMRWTILRRPDWGKPEVPGNVQMMRNWTAGRYTKSCLLASKSPEEVAEIERETQRRVRAAGACTPMTPC